MKNALTPAGIEPATFRFVAQHLNHCANAFGAVSPLIIVDYVWNVMAHAHKPDFVFRRNGRVHLNRRWASVQSTIGSRGVRISGSNAGYTMFRGSVKGTGYPIHSPVSPSLPTRASPCATTFQLEYTTDQNYPVTILRKSDPTFPARLVACFWSVFFTTGET